MRRIPWPRSLSVKLGLVLFVVVAVAIGIVYLAIVPRLESRLVSNTIQGLSRSTPLIANNVIARQQDQPEVQLLTQTFQNQLNARVVVFHQLTETSLIVWADSANVRSGEIEDDPIALAAATTTRLVSGRVERDGKEYAEVARVLSPTQQNEILLLSAPLADSLSAVEVVRRDIIVFGAVALAISWLVGAFGALAFTRRIKRLEAAAERLADGDFAVEVHDDGRDEVAQLARTFDRMRVRLAGLDRARREFIANASHELRTPLFALGGFLELLADEELDEGTRRDFLETARGQVERLGRLATDLLDLSRLDAGQLGLDSEPVDLALTAQVLADEFRGLAEGSGHVLRVARDDEAIALGDEQRILQVGRSLVENALRHTPAGTVVEVGTEARAGRSRLWVHDTGPGVRPEDQGRLFERFYRGEGGAAFGSGIGLAIAHELATLMGGTIELSSEPGSTTFGLALPTAPAAAPFSRENVLTRT